MPAIITAADFTEFERDTRPDTWDAASLRRLVPFLDGVDVIVVTHRDTGTAVRGRITGISSSSRTSDYPQLHVTSELGDTTLYRVSGLGPIMILDDGPASTAKWQCTNAMHEERARGLRAVQQFIGTDFPAGAPYKGGRKWLLSLTWDGVLARWGTSTRDRSWKVDENGNASTAW